MLRKSLLILGLIVLLAPVCPVSPWSWNSADNVIPSLREELDNEIAAYRQQVGNGMPIRQRILTLDRIIGTYQPLGLNLIDLETERSRLTLQEQQQLLRSAEVQDEASMLYERGVAEYREGHYRPALDSFQNAERLLPEDRGISEVRRRLERVTAILEREVAVTEAGRLIRLAVSRYLENDPRRALNAIVYALERNLDRPELQRLKRLVETEHPDVDGPRVTSGMKLVDHKLQLTLQAIYEGRYLTAISECTDVLDLEADNVLALTRLGSAYFAMNERDKARQIWTRALQLDPDNNVLKRFLYGQR